MVLDHEKAQSKSTGVFVPEQELHTNFLKSCLMYFMKSKILYQICTGFGMCEGYYKISRTKTYTRIVRRRRSDRA